MLNRAGPGRFRQVIVMQKPPRSLTTRKQPEAHHGVPSGMVSH